jgi:DNA polymerase-3 subunit beta
LSSPRFIHSQITEQGAITVPARTFSDLVNQLPDDTVRLDLNASTHSLNVRCGMSNTDIKGIDAQEFPPMPVAAPQEGVPLNVANFKEMIQQVAFAASTDEARPILQGVLMTAADNEVTLAATDGFRISVRKAALSEPLSAPIRAVIPARALQELARIATDGEQVMTMSVPSGRGQVIFHMKDAELSSLLIEGNFPDYKAIIPRDFKTSTTLTTAAFLKACRQAEIIARDGNYVVRLNILPGEAQPGKVEITAQSEETGFSENSVEATVDGPGLVIAFNVRFLREVLEVIKTPSVVLQTNANNTPAMIKPAGDDNYVHLIMPMHLG